MGLALQTAEVTQPPPETGARGGETRTWRRECARVSKYILDDSAAPVRMQARQFQGLRSTGFVIGLRTVSGAATAAQERVHVSGCACIYPSDLLLLHGRPTAAWPATAPKAPKAPKAPAQNVEGQSLTQGGGAKVNTRS